MQNWVIRCNTDLYKMLTINVMTKYENERKLIYLAWGARGRGGSPLRFESRLPD